MKQGKQFTGRCTLLAITAYKTPYLKSLYVIGAFVSLTGKLCIVVGDQNGNILLSSLFCQLGKEVLLFQIKTACTVSIRAPNVNCKTDGHVSWRRRRESLQMAMAECPLH